MKKTVCIIVVLALLWAIALKGEAALGNQAQSSDITLQRDTEAGLQKNISSKLIRFHILANSDSKADQELKMAVRDQVLDYMTPKLKNSRSIEESRNIIKNNDKAIKEIAERVIRERGYNYQVSTVLSVENFPIKAYGNITLPQGKYEAYRILIGSGKGQNWWCVMFPPLCFVDLTKGNIAEKETEAAMRKVLNDEEYTAVNNQFETNEIKIEFKIVELFRNVRDRFKTP
jgi:stage II sporulation protein R